MMLAIYIVVLSMLAILFLAKRNYKKKLYADLAEKKHPLKRFYGPAMWVSDHLPERIVYRNVRVNQAVKKMSVKENVREQVYLYVAGKVALVLVIVFVGAVLGLGSLVAGEKDEIVKILKRGTSEKTYTFVAEKKGKKENVNISVEKQKLTKKEIRNVLEKSENQLKKKILGKNKSLSKVNQKIDLVDSIGDYNVGVTWHISDSKVLGYDGEPGDTVDKGGELVKLTATLELEKETEDYVMTLKVFPKKKSSDMQSEIQEYVDEQPLEEKEIELPSKIKNEKYSFYQDVTKMSLYILPICLVLGIAFFLLKDKDLDKEVEKRNKEMIVDYPEIVSKFLIYFGAGLSFKSALERIIAGYKREKEKTGMRYAYEEMDYMYGRIKNGVSEMRAIGEFGERCKVHCYMKFSNIIGQNLKRGTNEMIGALKAEVDIAMTERKNNALKTGAEISTKLLGPMVLMLMIAIAVIMLPALLSMDI